MHTVSDNVCFKFKNEYFKTDNSSLPIGGTLSSFLAGCYSHEWLEEVKKKAGALQNERKEYFYYVDDGSGIWVGSVEGLLRFTEEANKVNPKFQVTCEHTGGAKKTLVVLDLELWVSNGRIQYQFFRKETAKNYCLPADSAHSTTTKASYIQMECVRIRCRCSKQEYAWLHLENFRQRLVRGGYPRWFISLHFNNGFKRYMGIVKKVQQGERDMNRSRAFRVEHDTKNKRGPPGEEPTVWVPALSRKDTIVGKLKAAARSSGLGLVVREVAGENIKQRVCRAVINPTADNKLGLAVADTFPEDVDDPRWFLSDVVYRFMCVHCEKSYTGETKQPLCKRAYQHWSGYCRQSLDESALVEHHCNEHPGLPLRLKLTDVIPTKGFVDRKTTEAVVQELEESDINRRIEGERTVGNLYL